MELFLHYVQEGHTVNIGLSVCADLAGEGGGAGAHDGAAKHRQSSVQQARHGYRAGTDRFCDRMFKV